MTATQLVLFDSARPAGLGYVPEFISHASEEVLISHIRGLPLIPFQFGEFEGKRKVASFGWHYNFSKQMLERAEPIPEWIAPVVSAVEHATGLQAGSIGHVLFTEYDRGAGIGWHRDKNQFDKIFGVSLASPCDFRFRRKRGAKWLRYTMVAEPRSLYTMADEARSIWEHSIPSVDARRYSITFRTMVRR